MSLPDLVIAISAGLLLAAVAIVATVEILARQVAAARGRSRASGTDGAPHR